MENRIVEFESIRIGNEGIENGFGIGEVRGREFKR